tara:strand:- start:1350 stop:2585 length:1236 start_codon:yes stop_codon:yes gene_type:complete
LTIFVNVLLAIVVALALCLFLSRRLLESARWRATVTPLASIIGSGFLVSIPLLSNAVGNAAIYAMAGLVLYAFWVGGAIRFNILYGEPIFEAHAANLSARVALLTERVSQIALACAYFVSVAYYLSLLSLFLLKGLGQDDPWMARALTTGLLVFIGMIGFLRGLKGLERIEEYAVGFKLAVIVAILVALAGHNVSLFAHGEWALNTLPAHFDVETFRALLGFVIVVQGFETSRFLAGEYPPEQRVRTMRDAQILSGGIYLVFFALATVMFKAHFADGEVAAIVDMVGVVAIILPLLLTAAAIASQFSASVADAIGGAGLMHQAVRRRIPLKMFYPLLTGIAVLIVWTGSVFDIIALASRAFAFYYALQCLVAVLVVLAKKDLQRRLLRATWFAFLSLLSLGAALYGLPASA